MNNTKPIANSRQSKQTFWNHHIENWNDSGTTQVQYCHEHDLKLSTFQYWRRKHISEDSQKSLLPVSLTQELAHAFSSANSGVSININDRINVQLEAEFNGDTLVAVLDLLENR